jgi:LmbE family N-acetylglucosaminyl deacetylase
VRPAHVTAAFALGMAAGLSGGSAPEVVILSPHLDDAVLSCWSILTSRRPVTVINVFTGAPDAGTPLSRWDRLTGARDPRERGRERVQEDSEVLEKLGCEPINLGFIQDDYRGHPQDAGEVLDGILPRVTRSATVYAPSGIGAHPDHLTVRAAAVALHRKGFAVTLYGELPYASHYGWPHWITAAEPNPYLDVTHDWRRILDHAESAVSPEAAEIRRLDPEAQSAKLSAVQGYRTQFSGMERLLRHDDALAYEVFWPLENRSVGRLQSLRYELLWKVGVRRGSRLDQVARHPALRRIRPKAGSRVGRLLQSRGQRA